MTLRGTLRAATIALFATAASAATPSRAHAQDITCEPGDVEVRSLDFRGNHAIDDDDLERRVTTTPSSKLRRTLRLPIGVKRCLDPSRRELGRDLLRLKAHYRDRGFYSAQVDTVVEPRGRNAVNVIFKVNEGTPLRLTAYSVTGLEGVPDSADIVRRLQLKVGQPFDFLLYGADMDTIVRRLRDAGYYKAETIPGYEWDTAGVAHAEASISVVPGQRARFGPHEYDLKGVEGSEVHEIDSAVVRRVLGISPGQLYSDRAIVQAQRNLFQLGTYQHIDVAPLPDSLQPPGDTIVKLAVNLTEDYMRQLDSEFGWATLDCGRVRLQFTDKNFLRTARSLELIGQATKLGYGEPLASPTSRQICTLGGRSPLASDSVFSSELYYFTGLAVRQPRLLGTLWVPTLSIYSERRGEFKAYLRSTQIGWDLSATRDLGDRTPFRVGYSLEYGRTRAEAPALCVLFNRCDIESQEKTRELATLGVASATLARIRTDNVINPTRGLIMRGELRTSAVRLLGTSPSLFFNKGTGDITWYQPFGGQNVLAIRLRGGLVQGRRLDPSEPTGFIPPQERLYAGGPTSVRGFQQNELGSKVYIARNRDVVTDTVETAPGDTVFRFKLRSDTINPDTDINPDRAVPLGGNSLFVANVEYRIRDPFFFPDLVQYAFFMDGGDVWSPASRGGRVKWTPGIGLRALTPVGPVQINVGWNGHKREAGPLYYNPDVTLLACVSPGPVLDYRRDPVSGQLTTTGTCGDFEPPRQRWIQRLTFTFSIGPDF